jgi:hypothetical protein
LKGIIYLFPGNMMVLTHTIRLKHFSLLSILK